MASNLLTLVILGTPTLYLYLKKRMLSPAGYVLVLYTTSMFGALFANHYVEWYSIEAAAYLGFTLLAFFAPLLVHAKAYGKPLKIGNAQLLLPLARAIATLGLIALAKFTLVAGSIVANIRTPTEFRTEKIYAQIESTVSTLDYVALVGINLYSLFIAMYFVVLITHPRRRFLQTCLFASSLAYPLTTLAVDMSRGGLIMWCLMVGLIFSAFLPYLPVRLRRNLTLRVSGISMLLLFLFAILTAGRGAVSGDVSMYLVDYFSHQFGNFNRFFAVVGNQTNDISYIFPIIGYDRPSLVAEATDLLLSYGFSLNVFATFIGSLILHFSPAVVFAMSIAFALIVSPIVLTSPRGLGTLLLVIAICEVFVWGLFYFNHGWRLSNIVFFGYCGLAWLFNPLAGRAILVIEPERGSSCASRNAREAKEEVCIEGIGGVPNSDGRT